MGNQMFQYAFGRRMAADLRTTLKIDLSLLLDRARGKDHVYREYDLTIFKVPHEFVMSPAMLRTLYKTRSSAVCKLVRKRVGRNKTHIKEPHFHVSEDLLKNPIDNAIYDGWWQSERYFEPIAEEIQKVFEFVNPIEKTSAALLQQIHETQSVCLNVRRTDFLVTSNLNTTDKDYFLRGVKKIADQVSDPHFFIFSDDVEWCAANLNLDYPTVLVDHGHKGEKFGNYMQLMKACKHYIIPNSSFAWWAIWLNQQEEKIVIAPKRWFNDSSINTDDLVPKDWWRL